MYLLAINLSSNNNYNDYYLRIIYYFAITHLSTLSIPVHLNIIEMLSAKYYYHSHFTHEEAGVF